MDEIKIEYSHLIPVRTVALSMNFTKEQLISQLMKSGNKAVFQVGHAKFNPKDRNFSRKKGREVAKSRLTEQEFRLTLMQNKYKYDGDVPSMYSDMVFENDRYVLLIRLYDSSEKARFVLGELK